MKKYVLIAKNKETGRKTLTKGEYTSKKAFADEVRAQGNTIVYGYVFTEAEYSDYLKSYDDFKDWKAGKSAPAPKNEVENTTSEPVEVVETAETECAENFGALKSLFEKALVGKDMTIKTGMIIYGAQGMEAYLKYKELGGKSTIEYYEEQLRAHDEVEEDEVAVDETPAPKEPKEPAFKLTGLWQKALYNQMKWDETKSYKYKAEGLRAYKEYRSVGGKKAILFFDELMQEPQEYVLIARRPKTGMTHVFHVGAHSKRLAREMYECQGYELVFDFVFTVKEYNSFNRSSKTFTEWKESL